MQAAGCVKKNHIRRLCERAGESLRGDGRDIPRSAVAVKAERFLLGENLQLIDRRGPINVTSDHEGSGSFFLQKFPQFYRGGRFTRTMETDHEYFKRAARR